MIPDESGETSRTFRMSYKTLRRWGWGVGVAVMALCVMVGSWWYFAARSLRVTGLEAEVARYDADHERMELLAVQLEELETSYRQIRELFGTQDGELPSPLWLPPAAGGRRSQDDSANSANPTSWPLTERGFVTQGLLEGGGSHPGLDIAVAAFSYVRAAGSGTAVEVGEDPIYGNYIVIDHGEGLRTLYGHAAANLIQEGQLVRRNEVIALSGSSGQSTAPHLHFEITDDGSPVNPLDFVQQP
jgi:murein DD-endopeptidase MepM/ murein hydrolase activator NlpD